MRAIGFVQSVSVMAIGMMLAPAAMAQSSEAAPQDAKRGGLDEIVVTAQKRSEALSKAAAAISVIGQTSLDNVGARNFGDAVATLPNVSTKGLGGLIAIRGLGTSSFTSQSNGTVAYHLDGVFQNNKAQGSNALYDIERIEVLRGPQGTLYGRNATAGVVNVITHNAGRDFEAFGDVSYGRFNTLFVRGAVNVPVSDKFAVRLTGTYENSDDFRSFANGDHPRAADVLNLRLAWRADLSERLTWNARIAYTRDNSLQPVAVPTYLYDKTTGQFIRASNRKTLAALPSPTGKDGLTIFNAPGFPSAYQGLTYDEANTRNQRFFAFRSNLNFELSDELSLAYIMGYSFDNQKSPTVISGLQPYQVRYPAPRKNNDWSHELNLNYQGEDIKAILGLYAFQNDLRSRSQFTRVFLPDMNGSNFIDHPTPFLETNNGYTPHDMNKTRAVFGQLTYDLTDKFRVTGGARYNWDRSSFAATNVFQCPFGSTDNNGNPTAAEFAPGVPLCGTVPSETFGLPPGLFFLNQTIPGGAKSFEKFSWKLSGEYDLGPDTLLYATVATGYKAGGPATRTEVGDARFYRPETNINYEAGIRAKLFENTLSLNFTAFWTDYKDLQVETNNPTSPQIVIATNAGKSRSRGLELEYAWAPTPADRITGYVTYLDAKFRDFQGVDTLTEVSTNFRGNRLPGAPEFAGRISYAHTFDLGGAGTLTPTAQFNYQTKSYVLFTNNLPSRIPAYTRSDFIVRYEAPDKHVSVEAFVNNIENKLILSSLFPASNVSNAYFAPPRTWGVRLGYRY